jgi:hypothetical protein
MPDERPLTRQDFDDQEGWLEYCRKGGIDPVEGGRGWTQIVGSGLNAELYRATMGDSREAYEWTHEGGSWSQYLSFDQLQMGYAAAAAANCRGLVLNTFISITWSTVDLTGLPDAYQLQDQFLHAAGQWLGRPEQFSKPAAWLWTLENGPKYGVHSHVMMSVPQMLTARFRLWAEKELARIVGGPLLETADSKTVVIVVRPDQDVAYQWDRWRYLFKGIRPDLAWPDPTAPARIRLLSEVSGIVPIAQGEIRTGRMGMSPMIGPSAIAELMTEGPPSLAIDVTRRPSDLYGDQFLSWFYRRP